MPIRLLDIDFSGKYRFDYPKKINFTDFFLKKMHVTSSINGVVFLMNIDEMLGRSTFMTEFYKNFEWARVEVYSVNRGCWKDVDHEGELLFWPRKYHCNFIVKGAPYFVGIDVMPDCVVEFQHEILARFDPCTGFYKKIQYPEHFREMSTWAEPFEYQDSVAVMVQSTPGLLNEPMIDLYVLDDETSWAKMYTIGPFPYEEFHVPRQSFKTGEIVIEEQLKTRDLYLYDPKSSYISSLIGMKSLKPLWMQSYSHTESLVSVKGMELIGKWTKTRNICVLIAISLLRVDKIPIRLLDIDCSGKYRFDYPRKINFTDFSKKMHVTSSINGVVLLMNIDEILGRFVVLWNPAINQWKPIKIDEKAGGTGLERSAFGLGYDEGNDDLKIIRVVTRSTSMTEFYKNFEWARVEVYSVNRGCWKDIDHEGELLFWPWQYHCNFIVKGAPYFVGIDVMPDCVDSVDVMVQSTPGLLNEPMIDLYVLDDKTSSWTKMYTIGPFPYEEFHVPRQSFKTGEIVIEEQLKTRDLYLYDPKSSYISSLIGMKSLKPLWMQSYSHRESLVSVKGMELIGKEDKNKKTKAKKKNMHLHSLN
ncbi:hypothetical protein POM88_023445 [Heracleum sosnowskyi]|uniref:F-box associated beta-propeller type 1 domain-containing protein n=1 Tax=Heracleum sosnowskyi TaxID=360622 RepID=A0AAD8MQG9_9APIA|nr:hypothetical protein POM88_023445 [Heracleum sosnowskyi]